MINGPLIGLKKAHFGVLSSGHWVKWSPSSALLVSPDKLGFGKMMHHATLALLSGFDKKYPHHHLFSIKTGSQSKNKVWLMTSSFLHLGLKTSRSIVVVMSVCIYCMWHFTLFALEDAFFIQSLPNLISEVMLGWWSLILHVVTFGWFRGNLDLGGLDFARISLPRGTWRPTTPLVLLFTSLSSLSHCDKFALDVKLRYRAFLFN